MSVRYDITDQVSAKLKELKEKLRPELVNKEIAAAVANEVKDHLFKYNSDHPNKDNWPRQNLASQFAKSTHHESNSLAAEVIISHIAFRQRLQGGVILPRNAKYLTLPAIAAAYGRRAREFSNLHFGFAPNPKTGRMQAALLENRATNISFGRQRKDGSRKITATSTTTGSGVVYWLARKATQKGDLDLLPNAARITAVSEGAIDSLVARYKGGVN